MRVFHDSMSIKFYELWKKNGFSEIHLWFAGTLQQYISTDTLKKSCYFISLEQKLQSNVQLNSLRHQEIRGHSKKKSFITESSWKTEFFCTVFRSPKCDPLQGQKKLTIISNLVVISLATRIQTIQKFFHPMVKSGMYWITKSCKKMLIQVVKHWRKSPKHG